MASKRRGKKDTVTVSLLCAISTVITFVIYPVYLFYQNNRNELWFSLDAVMPQLGLIAGAVLIGTFLIQWVFCRIGRGAINYITIGLFAWVNICYYIQYNYLSYYLPVLTGDDINWEAYAAPGMVGTIMWCGILILMIALFFFKRNWLWNGAKYCFMVLISLELLTVGMTFLTHQSDATRVSGYFAQDDLYSLSQKGNIVFIVSDTFEGTFMNQALEERPEVAEELKDFTYYDNATGTGSFTYFSLAQLITGVQFPLGYNSDDGIQYCFDHQTLLDLAADHGYETRIYSYFCPAIENGEAVANYIDDAEALQPTGEASLQLTKLLLSSAAFQGAPIQLKPYLITLAQDFENVKSMLTMTHYPYYLDDFLYRERLQAWGITAKDTMPNYVIIHLNGIHAPYSISREFEEVQFDETYSREDKQLEGALAQLKLLKEYVDALKAADVYDETTIIFTADHGYDMRFYPVLLVKEANSEQERMAISHLPYSFASDYPETLQRIMNGETFEQAAVSIAGNDERVRYAYDYRSTKAYGEQTNLCGIVEITGAASDPESYHIIRDEFFIQEDDPRIYQLGEKFIFDDSETKLFIMGCKDGGYAYCHSARLSVYINGDVNGDLEYTMTVQNQRESVQQLIITAGETELYHVMIEPQEIKSVQFQIPRETMDGNHIELEFSFPNAELVSSTDDILSWNDYLSFYFSECVITEAQQP